MLQRVEITNYRSCHGVVLDNLGAVTVLIGRNAVGKSNILRGIQWAASAATAANVDEIRNAYVAITLRVSAGASVFDYFIRLLATNADPKRQPGGDLSESLTHSDAHTAVFERENEKVTIGPWEAQPQTINIGRYAPVFRP